MFTNTILHDPSTHGEKGEAEAGIAMVPARTMRSLLEQLWGHGLMMKFICRITYDIRPIRPMAIIGGTPRFSTCITNAGTYGAWELDARPNFNGLMFSQVRADGGAAPTQNSYYSCPNSWDGNWHRYEIYVHKVLGIYRFWYDGNLTIDLEFGSIWSTSPWVVNFGSVDANTKNVFTRFIDDIEIWDGMPNEE